MKQFKILIWPIIFFLISLAMRLITNTNLVNDWLETIFAVEKLLLVKDWINVANFLIFVAPLGIMSILRGYRADKAERFKKNYGEQQSKYIYQMLVHKQLVVHDENADFNIRFFKKHFGRLVSEDSEGFCQRSIGHKLSFSIKDNQGLCVWAYNHSEVRYEFDNVLNKTYHLNEQQKVAAKGIKFLVAVPICNQNDNKVKCVICFDSHVHIAHKSNASAICSLCQGAAYHIYDVIR